MNMKNIKKISLFAVVLVWSVILHGRQPENYNNKKSDSKLELRAGCAPGRAQVTQEINNVRARLLSGGDVWWDLQNGRYEVPKGSGISALFAGGVWVGGVNTSNQIKLAGVTYRNQNNNFDWYPGPLDLMGATTDDVCRDWDKFFRVNSADVFRHINSFSESLASGTAYDCDSIPDDVKYWPGRGNPYWREKYNFALPDQNLGSFVDRSRDGIYDPCDGDYPTIQIRGCRFDDFENAQELIPDEMFFWIYNDNGNAHRLSAGPSIQMEVQVQAFAYATNDEINDMTFQRYRLINKANEDLVDTYFAMWVDPDLGCYSDDYIGCDVDRSLAYTYNEDDLDGFAPGCACRGVPTYCDRIPMVGTDYFRGPRGPKVFLRNSNGEIILDENGNPILRDPEVATGDKDTLIELGMTSFIYMNNAGVNNPPPPTTDPEGQDQQFYNYLRGLWRDGTPLTRGGTGFNPESSDTVKYVFPDSPNDPNGWSMCTVSLGFGDRRTLQATGPLLLQPGAIEELIIGVVFVPDIEHPCPDITRLQFADDIAQSLFDNCFDITDGPDAPDMFGVELDRELILVLSNDTTKSNNKFELYEEVDLQAPASAEDKKYRFEGYKIYQLANANVSVQELNDISKARLIFQVDKNNGISEIFNWRSEINPLPGGGGEQVWTFTRMVDGEDKGIRNAFQVLEDQFATGNRALVNHRQYYFTVVAYAYNNYEDFEPREGTGQRRAYLEGRRNLKNYVFTPRPIVYGEQKAVFGEAPIITRLSGVGNQGVFLELEDGIREAIVKGEFDGRLVYKENAGPLDIRIFNPLEILDGKYRLELLGEFNSENRICAMAPGGKWKLTDLETGEVIASEKTLEQVNQQLIYRRGFSVSVNHVPEPGDDPEGENGAVGQILTYADPNGPQWFNAVIDGGGGLNIGGNILSPVSATSSADRRDPGRKLSRMGTGHFFPFALARSRPADPELESPFYISPAWRIPDAHANITNEVNGNLRLQDLPNVDIVFTSNKDLWSRCIVVETASPDYYAGNPQLATFGNSRNFDIKERPSVDKNGNPDNTGTGFSWFPGYAIDVETGKRLNIFFGENSVFNESRASFLENGVPVGDDMIFNPSAQIIAPDAPNDVRLQVVLGGQHFIYVSRQEYDGCADLGTRLRRNVAQPNKNNPISSIAWTSVAIGNRAAPMLSLADGLIPNDLVVKLRVNNRFNRERILKQSNRTPFCDTEPQLPIYEFEFKGKQLRSLEQPEYAGALSNINVVPNPYYAYSAYENSQFSNVVRITNLPMRSIVTIYNIEGNFVRRFDRDERPVRNVGSNPANREAAIIPFIEWDLKNAQGIPVGSGVYLVHILVPELGEERTLKLFVVNRQFDPSGL